MNKVFILLQESNCDGEILINTTPCVDLETAKREMQKEINTLLTESKKYKGLDLDAIEGDPDADYVLERDETSFYLSCNYDDYYEHLTIEEKEVVGSEEKNKELYDKICQALTWYENPDEYPLGENDFNRHISEELYNRLVEVQNNMF